MASAPVTRSRLQATFACAGAFSFFCWRGGPVLATAAGITASLALLAWFSPSGYAPVQRTLDRIVHAALTALTWILLGVVYLLLFTPIRLCRAMTGNDPLQRRADSTANTYLRPLPPAVPGRFDRQF
jgi:hypothetical protein